MCTITLKLDDDVKKQSQALFDEIGLSMSGAINIFLKACIRNNGIPFELKSQKYDDILMKRLMESEDLSELSPKFDSWEEAKKWMRK